jgi:superfamily II DNA or RNA helicase
MPNDAHFDLPPVVYSAKSSTGEVVHILAAGGSIAVTGTRELRVSPRCTETLHVLANGQSVILTERKLSARPPEADGILRPVEDGSLKWVSHRLLEEFHQEVSTAGWAEVRARIAATWADAFRFKSDSGSESGLRPPQLGALHAIGAHWSLQKQAATVIMPTGTGKTETMLAALVAFVQNGTLLVIVPSRVLREQTARKFEYLGLLRTLGVLLPAARNPVVGIMRSRPQTEADLAMFENCHVVLGTISALGQGEAAALGGEIAERVSALFVDEAHHIPADSWSTYREHFNDKRVLQFTATPFRRDGKLVDGRVIYNYPLRTAQQDGYFKPISFEPVFEIDPEDGDRAIADSAVKKLRADLAAGRNHLLMARCDSITRASEIHGLYAELASDFAPLLVHSEAADAEANIERLRSGRSRIVVCVDMLGEGFDLPQLKIAAIHDTHKSLAILLQFTGRFTRTADPSVGDATVIANIANQEVSAALERLYSEDADWNLLLRAPA